MLNFTSERFRRLGELSDDNQATFYITDVVYGEVKRSIVERLKEAAEFLGRKDVKRIVGYLSHAPSAEVPGISRRIDSEAAAKDIDAAFEELLRDLSVTFISSDSISVAEIRRRYFEAVSPFAP